MDKEFPWTCGNCAKKTVYPVQHKIYEYKILYEEEVHELSIPYMQIPTCNLCNSGWMSILEGDIISRNTRNFFSILHPEEIAISILENNLSLEKVSEASKLSREIVLSVIKGHVYQSRKIDNILREILGIK